MSFLSRLKHRYGKLLIVGIACALLGFAVWACAATQKQMVVRQFQEARFEPLNPEQTDGPQIAVLWGDPTKGPSTALFKFKKDYGGRLHTHTADYHLSLLQGTMKHWAEGEQETDVKPLTFGSYWFQPGNQVHADNCLTDECVAFVKFEGKIDANYVEEPNK